jgi:DNA-binding transcriptional regulator YiaG
LIPDFGSPDSNGPDYRKVLEMARSKSLSRSLRLAREARGLTVSELADRVGVSAMAVYNWEAGRSRPRSPNLSALCKVLRVRLADAEAMV